MEFEYEKATAEEKVKHLEYENLQLRKTILELQFKLLPYQHKELSDVIEKHAKESGFTMTDASSLKVS